ncbi:MAG: hypothetical protein JWO94_506 [Verrucomicrobiaceae bacterium]|nr:hypothetical protein [Verrucomicrobiaceae bacterium]
MKSFVRLLFLLLLTGSFTRSNAFPPAPYYTLYGMIRDQVGQTISSDGSVLLLLKGGVEIARTVVTKTQIDQNYELAVRIDQNRSGTVIYSDKAVAAQGAFSVVVLLNGVQYLPIEASGSLTAGKGGERIRLDLNLGEDANKDGLPDIWQEWQLYGAGYSPDANGNWPLNLITKNGSFFKNGLTNWQNYIAGTFSGDPQRFGLDIKQKTDASVSFQFYAITGKTYTIERSADMKTWAATAFSVTSALGAGNAGVNSYTASDVGIMPAYAIPVPGKREFYRLTVR